MEKRIRSYVGAGICLLLAAGLSFGLPDLLLGWQDDKRIGRVEQEEAAAVVLTDQPELTIVEKIRLVGRSSSRSMVMEKGRNYSADTIEQKVQEELDLFTELGILSGTEGPVTAADLEVSFVMDVEGENSMLVWTGQVFLENGGWLDLFLDDETGKILYLMGYNGLCQGEISGEELAKAWGDYLGCYVASMAISDWDDENPAEAYGYDDKTWKKYVVDAGEVNETTAAATGTEDVRVEKTEIGQAFSGRVCYGDESGLEVNYDLYSFPLEGVLAIQISTYTFQGF